VTLTQKDVTAIRHLTLRLWTSKHRDIRFSKEAERMSDADFLGLCYLEAAVEVLNSKGFAAPVTEIQTETEPC